MVKKINKMLNNLKFNIIKIQLAKFNDGSVVTARRSDVMPILKHKLPRNPPSPKSSTKAIIPNSRRKL